MKESDNPFINREDDALDNASTDGMSIGSIRDIGRPSDLNHIRNQSISEDTLMGIFSEDDEDDNGTDYDGDGEDNDLNGEPDGE